MVRIRHGDRAAHNASAATVQGRGLLDSGAGTSVVPLWLAHKLGVSVSEESKRTMHSVSGRLEAYEVDVGMDVQYGRRWLGMGVIRAVAPDTAWSRDPNSLMPFLLGLDSFFSRFEVCISHAKKLFWLGKVGDWPGEEHL